MCIHGFCRICRTFLFHLFEFGHLSRDSIMV
jgi:hypothetical protein